MFDILDFQKAVGFALEQGATVGSVSGGGEPLLMSIKDPVSWQSITEGLALFTKRDLHSNLSLWPTGARIDQFTNVTISLWPNQQTTQHYMGRDLHERIVRNCLKLHDSIDLRVSSVLGRDWCASLDDIIAMIELGKSVGATQITLREMTYANHIPREWWQEHYLPGEQAERWIAEHHPLKRHTAHGAPVFDVQGIEVCCYTYPQPGDDQEFLFYRPDHNGVYGLFTDYQDDSCRVEYKGGALCLG